MSQPILGDDFFRTNLLLVDIQQQCLVQVESLTSIPLWSTNISALGLNAIAVSDDNYALLLTQFPQISTPKFSQVFLKHGVQHHIPSSGLPINSQARRLSLEKLALAKKEFETMHEMEKWV